MSEASRKNPEGPLHHRNAQTAAPSVADARNSGQVQWIKRHALPVRLSHWISALAVAVLVLSGLQIFNAHPALYWGDDSDWERPWLSIEAVRGADGDLRGVTTIFGHRFDTTGFLGVSAVGGTATPIGFPSWATVPGHRWLAMGRRWHFFFAWMLLASGLFYIVYSLVSRHFRRDLLPRRKELTGIGHSLRNHLLFRFPKGDEARHYNILQKCTYIAVMFVLLPTAVLAGMTLSPWLDTLFPGLLTVFDGRQSARTVHFIAAFLFVLFVLVHVFMVLVSGVWNNLRSMISGRYAIRVDRDEEAHDAGE